ncbi:hypothetical protein ROJ8625_02752 [Roseivivax jejudonensis]|uniref:Uncharacterized protein n=1 Tax=Roseivivax jejudonensis TaxID=1529041 RepID=A0A1X6ZK12_9RHOB|nr:hypothetical protein [Roseivivax jejudonensis]SLN53828.1 hypothetical protein ROJ8625_02752 [Roseivivax jejudonensis]
MTRLFGPTVIAALVAASTASALPTDPPVTERPDTRFAPMLELPESTIILIRDGLQLQPEPNTSAAMPR